VTAIECFAPEIDPVRGLFAHLALHVLDEAKDAIDSTGDRLAIAKRDAMIASLKASGDRSGPPPLFSDGFSNSGATGPDIVPAERIEQLRRASESAAGPSLLGAPS